MSQRETSQALRLPLPARAFVRCGGEKLFGGFVVAVHETPEDPCADEVWEVEITFVRRLSRGQGAIGMRLDQAMTASFLSRPETLERDD